MEIKVSKSQIINLDKINIENEFDIVSDSFFLISSKIVRCCSKNMHPKSQTLLGCHFPFYLFNIFLTVAISSGKFTAVINIVIPICRGI